MGRERLFNSGRGVRRISRSLTSNLLPGDATQQLRVMHLKKSHSRFGSLPPAPSHEPSATLVAMNRRQKVAMNPERH